jgi:hypothetical protein
MSDTPEDPVGDRFTFWASYYGGDPTERDKMQWVRHYPRGSGGGLRHEDAKPTRLLRYDRKSSDFGITIAGTFLDRTAGVWRDSDSAYRNYFRGGDYGDGVSPEQATEILVEWGFPPELLTADPDPESA